ncbi:MAG TPA: aldehyde dehydrogenase family protein [Candidatus Limnocylindria bacterium]|nr:aldehyde dehydrogenase family protein [Candidatus Limnocylindria bacterium]
MNDVAMLINGEPRPSTDGRTFTTRDPARGIALADVPHATNDDVDAAVDAARAAFHGPWARTSPARRARMLNRLAELVERDAERLAELESRNNGKPRWQCLLEIRQAVSDLEFFAGAAQHLYGRSFAVSPSILSYTLREPVGVCAAIIPWNYPLMMAAWKLAPALAAGCTLVMKPASATPLTALELAALALEAGIPAGVFNVVTGPGAEVGEALAAHPAIDKIAFTGETGTGRRIAAIAAEGLKRVSLELGGKSPNVVFADADLEAAIAGSLWAIYYSGGQSCEARSRILVEESIHDEFVTKFAEKASRLRLGDPLADETQIGSMISPAHARKILGFVTEAVDAGATLVTGGAADGEIGADLDSSAFVRPTVVDGVANASRIGQEEVFGPVVATIRAASLERAIEIANSVDFGLSASIFTRDIGLAFEFIREIRAGMVHVNSETAGAEPHAPFGGMKGSSSHSREQGKAAVDFYTETKTVYLDMPQR